MATLGVFFDGYWHQNEQKTSQRLLRLQNEEIKKSRHQQMWCDKEVKVERELEVNPW